MEVDKRIQAEEVQAFAEEQGMPQDIMCMPATRPNNVAVGDSDEDDSDSGSGDAGTEHNGGSDSDTSISSDEPTTEHVLNKDNCDNE